MKTYIFERNTTEDFLAGQALFTLGVSDKEPNYPQLLKTAQRLASDALGIWNNNDEPKEIGDVFSSILADLRPSIK